MGKKIVNENILMSPEKDSHREVKVEADQRGEIVNGQRSNDNKKSQHQVERLSTDEAQDNPQVEEHRRQTVIRGFDAGLQEDVEDEMMDMIEEMNQRVEAQDDNQSRASTKRDSEYIKFFKHYYDKYRDEHPNWTPKQITKIISLLWKKKKTHQKSTPMSKPSSGISRRSNRPLTGKEAFRIQHKDLTKQRIDQIWIQLPQQSKNYWKREGDNFCTGSKLSEVSSVKDCKVPLIVHNAAKNLLNMA